ncbi:DUF6261 family protein [Tenacibaculum maritimum]|uniref:DUF6261 family protein n=1 Tax=Tenacibaculum maritimum TaxID=107401 RepID=UPI0012E64BFF|nr:DUF6261 family protein [Tenacibaculum maritimum]CAA0222293.1 hypothetical protein JIP4600_380010 [Tenacibaculum maritimum]
MNVPFLNRYRYGEFLQYLKDVLKLLAEQDVTALQLTQQQNNLQPLVTAIDTVFKQDQGSIITQELVHLDEQRDKALTGLRYLINAYLQHYDTAIVNAATALFNNINKHGNNIQRLNYQEETAVLDSIITDWQTEKELVNAVTLLNIRAWLDHLKTVNTNFAIRYLARVEEQAANPTENILEFRTEATNMYRELIAHINAHQTLGTKGAYNTLQEQISVLAKQYNQVVENRTANNTTQEESKEANNNLTVD